jgi:hypothetical protein
MFSFFFSILSMYEHNEGAKSTIPCMPIYQAISTKWPHAMATFGILSSIEACYQIRQNLQENLEVEEYRRPWIDGIPHGLGKAKCRLNVRNVGEPVYKVISFPPENSVIGWSVSPSVSSDRI